MATPMWVWRFSNYGEGEWSKPPAQGWDCREFQIDKLFQNNELTQRWGIPPLSLLALQKPQWAQTRQAWDHAVGGAMSLANAGKDYDLLICMRTIKIGDIIFLPKVGHNKVSDRHFTVLTVAETYRFKQRGNHPLPLSQYVWQQDFGHVIPVVPDLIRTFPYGKNTLQKNDFGAPFLTRIKRVPDYRFHTFLRNHNYPFTP